MPQRKSRGSSTVYLTIIVHNVKLDYNSSTYYYTDKWAALEVGLARSPPAKSPDASAPWQQDTAQPQVCYGSIALFWMWHVDLFLRTLVTGSQKAVVCYDACQILGGRLRSARPVRIVEVHTVDAEFLSAV